MSVCVRSEKPTTQPPRTTVRIAALGELRVPGVPGGTLAVEKDREIGGGHAIEAREKQIVEQRAPVGGAGRLGEHARESLAGLRGGAGRGGPRAGPAARPPLSS